MIVIMYTMNMSIYKLNITIVRGGLGTLEPRPNIQETTGPILFHGSIPLILLFVLRNCPAWHTFYVVTRTVRCKNVVHKGQVN